jgi:hypothetical protein
MIGTYLVWDTRPKHHFIEEIFSDTYPEKPRDLLSKNPNETLEAEKYVPGALGEIERSLKFLKQVEIGYVKLSLLPSGAFHYSRISWTDEQIKQSAERTERLLNEWLTRKQNKYYLKWWLLGTVLPPLVLLGFGAVMGWVFKGFKR